MQPQRSAVSDIKSVTAEEVAAWAEELAGASTAPPTQVREKKKRVPNWIHRGGKRHGALKQKRLDYREMKDAEYYGTPAPLLEEPDLQQLPSIPTSTTTPNPWFLQPARELPPFTDPRQLAPKHLPPHYHTPISLRSVR